MHPSRDCHSRGTRFTMSSISGYIFQNHYQRRKLLKGSVWRGQDLPCPPYWLLREQDLARQELKPQALGFVGLWGARGHAFWEESATSNETGAFHSSSVRTRLDVGITGDTLSWYLAGRAREMQPDCPALKSISALNTASLEIAKGLFPRRVFPFLSTSVPDPWWDRCFLEMKHNSNDESSFLFFLCVIREGTRQKDPWLTVSGFQALFLKCLIVVEEIMKMEVVRSSPWVIRGL